jgi:hypothetical protein
MAWISVSNITTTPVSSSKFDSSIRLMIALQLLSDVALGSWLRENSDVQSARRNFVFDSVN